MMSSSNQQLMVRSRQLVTVVSRATDPDKRIGPDKIREIFDTLGYAPEASSFIPTFLDGVVVHSPNNTEQPIAPMYCLSTPSALALAYLLLDQQPTLFLGDPTPFSPGSPFYYSQKVPWGEFAINGALRNMGTLAWYFRGNNGPQGGSIALRNCQIDIAFG